MKADSLAEIFVRPEGATGFFLFSAAYFINCVSYQTKEDIPSIGRGQPSLEQLLKEYIL